MPDDTLHEIRLSYRPDAQGRERVAQPNTIAVKQGHRIRFLRGDIGPGRTAVIIFTEPQFFSAATFNEGDPDIVVTAALPQRTFYQCGLKGPDGRIIADSLSGPADGGDIDPGQDTGIGPTKN